MHRAEQEAMSGEVELAQSVDSKGLLCTPEAKRGKDHEISGDFAKNDRDVKSRRRGDREPVRLGSKIIGQPRGHSRSTTCEHLLSELEHGDRL